MPHLFGLLAHEPLPFVREAVVDLLAKAPGALVFLYAGGEDPDAYRSLAGPRVQVAEGCVPCPWGRNHDFAAQMWRAVGRMGCDGVTVVDSDQVLLRAGYCEYVTRLFAHHSEALHAKDIRVYDRTEDFGPIPSAYREWPAWESWAIRRRFLRNYDEWPMWWGLWGGSIWRADLAHRLAALYWGDGELRELFAWTRMRANDEVPWTSLAGLRASGARPLQPEPWLRWREQHTWLDIEQAQADGSAFWLHPVSREPKCPRRQHLRADGTVTAAHKETL